MTPWHRIDNELIRRRLGWQWIANALGFDIQRVQNWKNRGVPARQYRAIADALGVTVDWIEGLQDARPTNIEAVADIGKVPQVSWVAAGTWNDISDPYPIGMAEDWLACPSRHSSRTFALKVRGSSMYNPGGDRSYREGDIIFVDPERQPEHKSLVICRLDDSKEATFKRLLIEGEVKMLEALNPSWPERIIKVDGNATICGVVIGRYEGY